MDHVVDRLEILSTIIFEKWTDQFSKSLKKIRRKFFQTVYTLASTIAEKVPKNSTIQPRFVKLLGKNSFILFLKIL